MTATREKVGNWVGSRVGLFVTATLTGRGVGFNEGRVLGDWLGISEGSLLGDSLGNKEGWMLGPLDG